MVSNLERKEKYGVFAVYNENGKLLRVKTESIDVLYGKTYTSHDFDLTGITDKKLTVKYFVWEKGSIKPLLPLGKGSADIE